MSIYVSRINRRLDQWIFHSHYTSQAALGLFRIIYALFFLIALTPNHHRAYTFWPFGTFPDSFFAPHLGPMMLFDGFPSPFLLRALTLVLIFALVLLLCGSYTKVASLTVAGSLLILKGFMYSFGKVDHDFYLIMLPFVMAFSGWGRMYSLDSIRARRESRPKGQPQDGTWAVALIAVFLGIMMATAGIAKIFGGWPSLSTHAVQYFVIDFDLQDRQGLLTGFLAGLPRGLFWEPLDYSVILLEVGFLFACISPRLLRIFCSLAVIFHFGIMLALNISFVSLLIVYAVFVPWDRALNLSRLQAIGRRTRSWGPMISRTYVILPAAFLVAIFFYVVGSPLFFVDALPHADSILRTVTPTDTIVLTLAALIVVILMYRTARSQMVTRGRAIIALARQDVRRRAHV